MELNQMIDVARQFEQPKQQQAIEQDNAAKTAFALGMVQRLPQEPPKAEEPKIPNLGAMAVPN